MTLTDTERPPEPLWRGLLVYRVLTLLSSIAVVLHTLDEFASPVGAVVVLVVMTGWTAVTTYGQFGADGSPRELGLGGLPRPVTGGGGSRSPTWPSRAGSWPPRSWCRVRPRSSPTTLSWAPSGRPAQCSRARSSGKSAVASPPPW